MIEINGINFSLNENIYNKKETGNERNWLNANNNDDNNIWKWRELHPSLNVFLKTQWWVSYVNNTLISKHYKYQG